MCLPSVSSGTDLGLRPSRHLVCSPQEEIQQLRSKLEKVEKERNELRLSSDRLETRVSQSSHQTDWPTGPKRPALAHEPRGFWPSEAEAVISTGDRLPPPTPDLRTDIGAD